MIRKLRQINITLYIIVASVLTLAMIDSHAFCYPSLSQSLLPNLLISFLGILASYFMIKRKLRLNGLCYLLLIWLGYIYSFSLFVPAEQYRQAYLSCSLLFGISMTCFLRQNLIRWSWLEHVCIALAILQVVYVLLQALHLVKSGSLFFALTGVGENPSTVAIYLACCLPLLVNMISKNKGLDRLPYVFFLIIVLFVVIILKCRTAYVGCLISFLVFICATLKKQKNQRYLKTNVILCCLLMCALFLGGFIFYKMKAKSADGRILIWKITTCMIMDTPNGYGYGMFERNYNLKQATYFQEGTRNEKEIMLADHVFVPYNDLLEQSVEGGLVGGLLYLSIYFGMIWVAYRKKEIETLSFGSSALGMSMINYFYTYPVVWLMLMCYFAKISVKVNNCNLQHNAATGRKNRFVIPVLVALISLALLVLDFRQINAQYHLKKYSDLLSKHVAIDENAFLALGDGGSTSELYYTTFAKNYLLEARYVDAINCLEKAKLYTSDPMVYLTLATSYAKIGRNQAALENVRLARNIVPHHFLPELLLLRIYDHIGNRKEALQQAHLIMEKSIKVHSDNVQRIKNEANRYIQAYEK